MVVWARLSFAQVGSQSQGSAERDVLREVSTRVESIAGRDENLKVSKITMHRYCASRYVVRVELGASDPSASCGGVEAVARLLVCPRAEVRAEPRRPEGEEWHMVESPAG